MNAPALSVRKFFGGHYEQEAEANFTNDAPMNVNSHLGYKLDPLDRGMW